MVTKQICVNWVSENPELWTQKHLPMDSVVFLSWNLLGDFSIEMTNKEVLRIFSFKVPYRDSISYFYRKKEEKQEKNKRDKESKDDNRVEIKVIVHDNLGKQTLFYDRGIPGEFMDVAYAAVGEGFIEVFVDGEFYTRKKIDQ